MPKIQCKPSKQKTRMSRIRSKVYDRPTKSDKENVNPNGSVFESTQELGRLQSTLLMDSSSHVNVKQPTKQTVGLNSVPSVKIVRPWEDSKPFSPNTFMAESSSSGSAQPMPSQSSTTSESSVTNPEEQSRFDRAYEQERISFESKYQFFFNIFLSVLLKPFAQFVQQSNPISANVASFGNAFLSSHSNPLITPSDIFALASCIGQRFESFATNSASQDISSSSSNTDSSDDEFIDVESL